MTERRYIVTTFSYGAGLVERPAVYDRKNRTTKVYRSTEEHLAEREAGRLNGLHSSTAAEVEADLQAARDGYNPNR